MPTEEAVADAETIAAVLAEFVASDYARNLCTYCNVAPTEYGQITGMFEVVRLNGDRLDVKLQQAFEQRSDRLLDKLVKHLRVRLPVIKRLQYETRSPPSTRILVV